MNKIASKLFPLLFGIFNCIHAQTTVLEEICTIEDNPVVFGIGLKQNYLYVNPGSSRIKIYDVSDPYNPINAGEIAYSGGFVTSLDISGDYLYTYAGAGNNFTIFDISNPNSPVELGKMPLPSNGNGIMYADHLPDYSYLTSYDTIYVINTGNKNEPFIENKIPNSSPGTYGMRGIYVGSGVLYVGTVNGLLIYELPSLSEPSYVSTFETGHLHIAVDDQDDRLFIAHEMGSEYTHSVLDIRDKFNPKLVSNAYGGSASWGRLLYNNGLLLQEGRDINGWQAVSLYETEKSGSIYSDEFMGSIEYNITDMDASDSIFFIAKNGGIELWKTGISEDEPEDSIKWFEENATWHYRYGEGMGSNASGYEKLVASGDTVINDSVFKIINRRRVYSNGKMQELANLYLRYDQESDQVYRYFESEEYLLYDFSAEKGDTINVKAINGREEVSYCQLVVDSIKIETFTNSDQRRVQYCSQTQNFEFTFGGRIIEGVGSEFFLLPIEELGCDAGCADRLRCYKDSRLIIQNPSIECDQITGEESKITFSDKCVVYPNPTNGILYLESEGGIDVVNVRLIDQTGRLQLISENSAFLDLQSLTDGLYYLEVFLSNQRVIIKKIIKD